MLVVGVRSLSENFWLVVRVECVVGTVTATVAFVYEMVVL